MNKISEICTIIILIGLCIVPSAALEISKGPVVIYEADDGYSLHAATDGEYILIAEEKWNDLKAGEEGYITQGSLYLYDVGNQTLTKIPSDSPPSMYDISVVGGVAFWKSTPYKKMMANGGSIMESSVYHYSLGDTVPKKLPMTTLTDTDGQRVVSVSGSELHPEDIEISVYDIQTGKMTQLPASKQMEMDSAKISGDLVAWSELRKTGDGLIYLCNLSSGERRTLGERDTEYLSLQDITKDQIFFFRSGERSLTTPYEYCRMNLTTGMVTVLKEILPEHHSAAVAYPLYVWSVLMGEHSQEQRIYAESLIEQKEPRYVDTFEGILCDAGGNTIVWAGWDTESDHATVSMATFAEIESGVHNTETTMPPIMTSASPLTMTIGSITFALACGLAILWRKK